MTKVYIVLEFEYCNTRIVTVHAEKSDADEERDYHAANARRFDDGYEPTYTVEEFNLL